MSEIKFSLPWPPTNNRYYRRVGAKTLISSDGRKYAKHVAQEMADRELAHRGIKQNVAVSLTYFEPDRRVRDIDGLQKALFDSLTKCGFWFDDRLVRKMNVEMVGKDDHSIPEGRVVVGVKIIQK